LSFAIDARILLEAMCDYGREDDVNKAGKKVESGVTGSPGGSESVA
jgi:hypothetical protein